MGDDPRLLELTLANGARVDDKDSYNGTGLIRAAERGHVRVVERLLEAGIDRDHVNRLGWTALLEAIILGDGGRRHLRTVRALVRGGVDLNIADTHGRCGDGLDRGECAGGRTRTRGVRPLAHARERGYEEIARVLESAGARA